MIVWFHVLRVRKVCVCLSNLSTISGICPFETRVLNLNVSMFLVGIVICFGYLKEVFTNLCSFVDWLPIIALATLLFQSLVKMGHTHINNFSKVYQCH